MAHTNILHTVYDLSSPLSCVSICLHFLFYHTHFHLQSKSTWITPVVYVFVIQTRTFHVEYCCINDNPKIKNLSKVFCLKPRLCAYVVEFIVRIKWHLFTRKFHITSQNKMKKKETKLELPLPLPLPFGNEIQWHLL